MFNKKNCEDCWMENFENDSFRLRFKNSVYIAVVNIMASGYGRYPPKTTSIAILFSLLMISGKFIACYILSKMFILSAYIVVRWSMCFLWLMFRDMLMLFFSRVVSFHGREQNIWNTIRRDDKSSASLCGIQKSVAAHKGTRSGLLSLSLQGKLLSHQTYFVRFDR